MTSSSGTKKAAKLEAPALSVSSSRLHVFVAMQDFAIYWNGCTLSFRSRTRYSVEAALKAALSATDRDLVWES